MNQRQAKRRLFFHHIFIQMPLWEVWDVPQLAEPEKSVAVSMYGTVGDEVVYQGTKVNPPRRDFHIIPRRLRRTMARARARREWQALKGATT